MVCEWCTYTPTQRYRMWRLLPPATWFSGLVHSQCRGALLSTPLIYCSHTGDGYTLCRLANYVVVNSSVGSLTSARMYSYSVNWSPCVLTAMLLPCLRRSASEDASFGSSHKSDHSSLCIHKSINCVFLLAKNFAKHVWVLFNSCCKCSLGVHSVSIGNASLTA